MTCSTAPTSWQTDKESAQINMFCSAGSPMLHSPLGEPAFLIVSAKVSKQSPEFLYCKIIRIML